MPRCPLIGFSAILLLLACTSPVEGEFGVELALPRESFAPGDPAVLLVVNRSEGEIAYGGCEPRLERRTPEGWLSSAGEEFTCLAMRFVLEAGGRAELRTSIAPGLEEGVYRFRLDLEAGSGGDAVVYSAPFRLRS